jgi:hypothetical protein
MKRRGKCNALPFRVPLSDAAPHESRSSRRRQPAVDLATASRAARSRRKRRNAPRVRIANLDPRQAIVKLLMLGWALASCLG